jgi:hypothetical protein
MSSDTTMFRLGLAVAALTASAADIRRSSNLPESGDEPEATRAWRRGNSEGLIYAYNRAIGMIEDALGVEASS